MSARGGLTVRDAGEIPPRHRPIRELSGAVAAQIAAGEVVERPAAALKELIENSADAGAMRVEIEIAGAGRERIALHDDGCGIDEAELALAFRRHATSKLARVEELAQLGSYGFRGEALPAIAAAAGRLRMISRAAGAERAAAIEFEDGVPSAVRPAARAVGTTVEIDDLFANQPARRAFLAGARAERAAILRTASDAVLARPAASLRLNLDTRTPLAHEPARGDAESLLRAAAASVFNNRAAERASWLQARSADGAATLDGLAGAADDARRTRDGLRLFVNGRPVHDRRLSFAVQEAYRGWLAAGAFPLCVVRLTVPPDAVDVNIHPAKTEVKLRDAGLVFSLVQRAIREALAQGRALSPPRIPARAPEHERPPWAIRPAPAAGNPGPWAALPSSERRTAVLAEPRLGGWEAAPSAVRADALPPLRMVGQLHRTFIIAEGPGGLVLVDQHGAHERILYERLLDPPQDRAGAVQPLLEPLLFNLDAVEAASWSAARARLEELGFAAEPFGERTLRLRAVPAALDAAHAERLLRGLLADLGAEQAEPERFDRAAASAACHGSVRRGAVLDPPAMTALLRDLERCRQPHTCPHGRPTLVEIAADDVLRQFRRK
ncbi:MAG: DNA mismatch repair endonuclease MutL [Chloroflexi bacterium]|nr:DNA mismatch repair endonuclease MutL [Chloroflexota bacterium]MYD17725.1 DNA mismatch repair endonuclease MutL [Chloroflexota bacterium]